YVYRDRRVTYAEWDRLSEQIAANLLDGGATKGDRLALLLPPRPEYPIAYLGAAKAGLVTVGVNPRLGAAELAHVLRDAAPRVVVAIGEFGGRDYANEVARLYDDLGAPPLYLVGEGTAPRFAPFESLVAAPSRASLERVGEVER